MSLPPAGYGKTTLLVDWLAQLPGDYAYTWLTPDEGDNDPRRFLTYLFAAMEQIQAGFGATIQSLLQFPQPQPDEVILTALINEMAVFSRPFVLVLDDYHFIRALAIHKQLAFILEHQPANMHLALITREDPLLPVARLRACGQVLEINQDNLRFTPEEVVKFLQWLMELPLSADEITTLERRTEGWIAGLQLAALSMQGRDDLSGFIQDFSGTSRFILDFLIEEVFKRQTPEVQDFLLQTSILGRLSGPLCAAVTQQADSQVLLETLEKANLFIVSLDQSRTWYRYHHLFAELLRHQLRATYPNLDIQLHRQASHWFEAEGLTGEANKHALAAQDWLLAASLIHSVYTSLLQYGEVLTVIGWFRSLPEDMLPSNPRLSFDYCWPLLLAGQYDEVAPLLDGLEQEAKNIPAFLGEIYAAQAYLARGVGNHERMIERSEQALELLPKSSISSRGIVAMNLGLAYWHTGRCWVCLEHNGEQVGFRGSTGDNQLQYYRCATVQEKAKGKGKVEQVDLAAITGVSPQSKTNWGQLIANHKPTMRAELMEGEIEKLVTQLVIPEDWYELILAYYVSDHGMADFERESYNLRQELNRAKELYTNGFINLAQFQERALCIRKELEKLKPSSCPEALKVLPLLNNFGQVWSSCSAGEKRRLLKVVLLAAYFDASSSVRMVLAHSPFDHLLPISQGATTGSFAQGM